MSLISYCGPSADPILNLVQKQNIRLTLEFLPAAQVWIADFWPEPEVIEAAYYSEDKAEATARAVYAMLKAKEQIDDRS